MRTRWLWVALALLISFWVLFPIYIIALSAFSDAAEISAWPKSFLPEHLSLETIAFFFGVEGVWRATLNSVIVAVLTMVFSIGLGAPAGYPEPDAHGVSPHQAGRGAALLPVRRRLLPDRAVLDLHLRGSQVPVLDVGHREPLKLGRNQWPEFAARACARCSAPSKP
jgi:hypothetical protein